MTVGFTRSPADVSGTATPTCHETVPPGTVTSAVVMILLNSTETGTIVCVVQRLALIVVRRPLISMQFSMLEPGDDRVPVAVDAVGRDAGPQQDRRAEVRRRITEVEEQGVGVGWRGRTSSSSFR